MAARVVEHVVGNLKRVAEIEPVRRERFFLRRFHLDELAQTLLTFGFLFMFADIALWIWGGNPMMLAKPAWLSGSVEIGDRVFPTYRLFLIAVGLAVGGALWWFQEGTRIGAMLRAGVDDEEPARGLAFVVVIVGGLGSLKGALVGALLVGLLDNFGKAFFPEAAMFTIFVPMAVILAVRPTGLFGRE